MTANELADKLNEIYTNTDYEEIKLSADMLRQQAEEIKILETMFAKAILKCASGNILSDNEVKN
jgi:hypothetical protein